MSVMIRPRGSWKRPLCATFSSHTAPKPPHFNRLKVRRVHDGEWIHSDLSAPVSLWKASAFLCSVVGLYRSVEIIPTGSVGVDAKTKMVFVPGFYWRVPWEGRLQHFSTQPQAISVQTRVVDSKYVKVFVSVLVQFELQDVKQFLEGRSSSSQVPLYKDPQLFFETNHYFFQPNCHLQSILTRHTRKVVEDVLSKESAIDAQFGTRDSSVLELGDKLQAALSREVEAREGIRIHRVTVTDLEFPHWVNENIERQMIKSWTMEKFMEQRKDRRFQQQQSGREQLRQYVDQVLEGENNDDDSDGEDKKK